MEYKAGTKCDNYVSGRERKDGPWVGTRFKKSIFNFNNMKSSRWRR